MLKRLCITCLALLAGACAPRVDASTAEACKTSLDAVVAKASGSSDSARFAIAMVELKIGDLQSLSNTLGDALTSGGATTRRAVPEPVLDSVARQATLCAAINGLSAGDIMKRAGALGGAIKDSLDTQRTRAYLAALRAAEGRANIARDSLAAFRVADARISQRDGNVGLETTITVTVENQTKHTIGRVFFGVAASSGGTVLVNEEVDYMVRGGIRPGDRAVWRVQPNRQSAVWREAVLPRDAQVVVTPTKLATASGELLWGGAEFTAADRKALESLSKK